MRLLWIAPLLLTGCAATQQDWSPEVYDNLAAQASPAGLCMVVIYGDRNPSAVRAANNEVLRRGLDCNQYRQEAALAYQNKSQRAAQADAAAMALSQQLLTPRPILAAPPPQEVNCQTFRIGSMLQTNCR